MNAIRNKKVEVRNLGLIDYRQAWDYQEELFGRIIATKLANRDKPAAGQEPTPNYLLFCEHPHVYTLGKSGSEKNLLLDEQGLRQQQAAYYKINRGGDITYHGPGQLVVYPILDLDNFFTDIHKYLRLLEQAVIDTLAAYGLAAGRMEGLTGVWLDFEKKQNPRKICAMGVRSSRWVTMHGLALNVNTNLQYFNNIIPCGIDDKAVTSMERELGRPLDLSEVAARLRENIGLLFGMEWA